MIMIPLCHGHHWDSFKSQGVLMSDVHYTLMLLFGLYNERSVLM